MVSLPQWKVHVAKSVVCASSQADGKDMEWFSESFQHGMTFAALADTGEDRYASLDIKLSVALATMIRGTPTARALCDDLVNREDAAFRAGRMLKGGQLAWMVNHFFRTSPSLDMVYRVEIFHGYNAWVIKICTFSGIVGT